MTYNDALSYIFSLKGFSGAPTLDRMRKALEYLRNPEKQMKFVHIAGTNGKGSTVSYVCSALRANGYKTGSFISPFILDFRERIQINGEMIGEDYVLKYTKMIIKAQQSLDITLTQFEFITLMGFLYFKEMACDIVVLEVGLGGRFDATNAIDCPLASAICSISLDHTAILGNTVQEIASEKAGIIKGGKVVCYPLNEEKAINVIKAKSLAVGATIVIPDVNAVENIDSSINNTKFSYQSQDYSLSLIGRYQIYNCITAIEVIKILSDFGFSFAKEATTKALNSVTFPCRFERVSKSPLIIIDGAHNPDAAKKLYSALHEFKMSGFTAIVGFMKDKAWQDVMKTMSPLIKEFIAVDVDNYRSLKAQEIKKYANSLGKNCTVEPSVKNAILTAKSEGNDIIIFGSLYLASSARSEILSKNILKNSDDAYNSKA